MAEFSAAVLAMMKQRAAVVKERLASLGPRDWQPRWDISGKNAIVDPGREIVSRLLPRWDFAQKFIAGGKINPKYVDGPIFFEALEHWWDGPDGKRRREWCPQTFGDTEACPIHEAWEELRASKSADDKKAASEIRPSETFLFNALMGPGGQRAVAEGGMIDIRYLPAPGTIFLAIINIMTGGEEESFAYGDISDVREGFDIKLSRPAAQGDRWKVAVMPKATPLFVEGQKPAFAKWWERLIDLPAMVEKEMKPYEDLYRAFHGSEPPGGTQRGPVTAASESTGGNEEGTAPDNDPFGDLGGIDMPPAEAASSAPVRTSAPAPAPRRPARR
mgnify:CR=1 FL=1